MLLSKEEVITQANAGNLIMEKCKKLSLKKRKLSSTNVSSIKEHNKNVFTRIDDPISPEIIALEEQQTKNVAEQRGSTEPHHENRSFTDVDDPNLRQLRQMIMRVSSSERTNGNHLPFPAYNTDNTETNNKKMGINSSDATKERLLSSSLFKASKDGLLPFPDLPIEYKRRKKPKVQQGKKLCSDRDKDKGNDSQRLPSVEYMDRRTEVSLPTQNSHLIRDRNSNYYSLQSRNQKQNSVLNERNTSTIPTSSIENSGTSADQKLTSSAQSSKNDLCNSDENVRDLNSLATGAVPGRSNIVDGTNSIKITESDSDLSDLCQSKLTKEINIDDKNNAQLVVPKAGSSKEESATSIPSRRGPDSLQNCPLCQQEFARNSTQLDIDSHIAQCLASTDEDVMW